jgi:DNA polymerase-4
MADTGTIIAASYEAKALKIKTGTRVGEAKAICQDIILVDGSHTVYSEFSHKIAAAVERCCPVAHTPSIDEMVCELMGREREPAAARKIALAIKQAIRDDVGATLRCSIGMAPNRYLAKIASDMQKPDGLIGLLPSQLPRAIAHLELRDLPGVGARTEARLNAKGITTMVELLALDRTGMHKLWDSVWGDRLYHWLRGALTGDDGAPVASEVQKSLGHSHVLGPEHRSDEGAWAVAHKLLHKAAMRLRMEKFYTGSLAVTVKYALSREQTARVAGAKLKQHTSGIKQTAWGMEARFRACQDTLSLLEAVQGIWKQRPQGELYARPFFVGVTLRNLIPEDEHQAMLFEEPGNRNQLSATMDKLNLKYGHTTLHFAGMLPARDAAPTRIAFTQIPVQVGTEYM